MEPSDRHEVVRGGLADLRNRRRGGPEDARDRTADRSDPPREDPGDVVGADVILPVPERLLAQEAAVLYRVADPGETAVVVGRCQSVVRRRVDRLVGGIVGDLVEERAKARQRTGQRPRGELEPRLAVGAKVVDPGGHGRDGCRSERFLRGVDIAFGYAHDLEGPLRPLIGGRRTEAGLGEQARHVVKHLATVAGILGKAVHDHDERQASLADATEHEPRDPVRIAGGRRHEQAQVGRFHQLVGEVAVGVFDAIDVGGVDEGQARGDVPILLDPEPARFDPGERASPEG